MSTRLAPQARKNHMLDGVDADKRVAVCRKCGPVQARFRKGHWECTSVVRTRVRHRIFDVDESLRSAACVICGPVAVVRKSGHWACASKALDTRAMHLEKSYGLTHEAFDELVAAQGGACLICKTCPERLHVDHDHESGTIRGLLCGPCNRALGMMYDDPTRLRAAADYLERRR